MGRGARGFSLPELLVALALLAVVFGGAAVVLQVGVATVKIGAGRTEAQANARTAVQRLVWDIREAGYDPLGAAFAAVVNQTASSITLQSDRNADGVIQAAPAGTCDPAAPAEVVRYRVLDGLLRRSVNPAVTDADPSRPCEAPIVGGMQALTLAYLDASGVATGVSANIRSVVLTVQLGPEEAGSTSQAGATMTDRVRLRNR